MKNFSYSIRIHLLYSDTHNRLRKLTRDYITNVNKFMITKDTVYKK